jgi:hypothetical protein
MTQATPSVQVQVQLPPYLTLPDWLEYVFGRDVPAMQLLRNGRHSNVVLVLSNGATRSELTLVECLSTAIQ